MGVVKFIGETHLGVGQFVGVELPHAEDIRKLKNLLHSGQVDGREYFTCKEGTGLLVPAMQAKWNGFKVGTLLSAKK